MSQFDATFIDYWKQDSGFFISARDNTLVYKYALDISSSLYEHAGVKFIAFDLTSL